MVVFLYDSYDALQQSNTDTKQILIQQKHKQAALDNMRNLARERTVLLTYMFFEKDAFKFDDYFQRYSQAARDFIQLRRKIDKMVLSKEEKELFSRVGKATNDTSTLQNEVIVLLQDQRYEEASQLFKGKIINSQEQVLNNLDKLSSLLAELLKVETKQVERQVAKRSKQFTIFATVLTGLSIIFVVFLLVYIFRKEKLHFLHSLKQSQEAAEKLSYQASHDSLTKLINRKEFEKLLESVLRENNSQQGAVLYLDLDQFKVINDTCGHHAGDDLLKQIAQIMERQMRQTDVVARLGGDEFGIILNNCDIYQTKRIAQKIIDCIAEYQFNWEDKIFKVGASIGIVRLDKTQFTEPLHEVLKQADSACFAAKDSGRNCYRIYSREHLEYVQQSEQMSWLSRINQALIQDKFVLYAQSITPTDADLGLRPSYELLVRLQEHEQVIPPGSFLPAAERYDQIAKIDKWVVTHALNTLKNEAQFLANIDHISINISGLSFSNKKFLDFLVDEITLSGLENKICLEITETAAINNISKIQKVITVLHGMGVRFSLDDFGSGMSSFAYLKNLKVDYLKIDGQFVKNILKDSVDRSMVKSIREIGHAMNKKIIAEFVENKEVLVLLKSLGIDYAQGYGIDKPKPLNEVIKKQAIGE